MGTRLVTRVLRITFRDGSDPVDVRFGAFAQIAAKRRFGIEVLRTDDPEPVLFATFIELEGPAAAKDPDQFDDWLLNVDSFKLVGGKETDDADPPPAEIRSGSLPGSPPTSV